MTSPPAGARLDPGLNAQLPFTATDAVRSAIASAGRTEDVKFSPDGRRLAIAGFNAGKLLLVDIDMDFSAGRKSITLRDVIEIASPDMREPHGLAFLDSGTLLVANRKGTVLVFRLPPRGSQGSIVLHAEPMDGEAAFEELASPGSLVAIPLGRQRYDILVCNNFVHQVTRHRLIDGERLQVRKNAVLLEEGLNLPDGVAFSPSHRWIAVSNHNTGSVLLYRNKGSLDRRSPPAGSLRGAGYPHGVRFTADSQFIFVTDAGYPFVHVYLGIGDDWRGTRDPVASLRLLSEEAYLLGRENPEEGGPKGIDIDDGMNVLAATCEQMPLAFFDLKAMLDTIARRSA